MARAADDGKKADLRVKRAAANAFSPPAAIRHQVNVAQGHCCRPNAQAPRTGRGGRRGGGTTLAVLVARLCVIRRGRREIGTVTDSVEKCARLGFAKAPMLGAAFGVALLAAATATGSDGLRSLFSLGGLIIVFGGVTAVAFMSFRPDDVCNAMGNIMAILKGSASGPDVDLRRDMEDIVGWSRVVYESGTRGLQRSLRRRGTVDPHGATHGIAPTSAEASVPSNLPQSAIVVAPLPELGNTIAVYATARGTASTPAVGGRCHCERPQTGTKCGASLSLWRSLTIALQS
jgi:hypothetical protein